jgi:Tfp pilus assembly protein PilF
MRYDEAKRAYDAGDYAQALRGFYAYLKEEGSTFEPGEAGLVYYRLGNCLLKMRNFKEAAATYQKALEDPDYNQRGAVNTNLGKACLGMAAYEDAIGYFKTALEDPSYQKPYQAQLGLGNAYMKLEMFIDAGTAYRNAALDDRNPNPIKALSNLGACFTELNRPQDAVEAYLAILDFFPKGVTQKKTYENLGRCYLAVGKYQEAVDAFQDAMRGSTYTLTDEGQADYQPASTFLADQQAGQPMPVPQAPPAADLAGIDTFAADPYVGGYEVQDTYPRTTGSFDPYTPVLDDAEGYGGGNVPSAQDTGFFTITDEALIAMSKKQLRKERKLRHVGLKVLLVIVILLVLVLGAAVFAYWQGYGVPSQQTVVSDMFAAHAAGEDVTRYWVAGSSDDAANINRIMNMVAPTSEVHFDYLSTTMSDAQTVVTATLPEGGTLNYDISLKRDMLGWKITNLNLVFASTQ